MATNIKMQRKTSDNVYTPMYPTSDAASTQRRVKIISYLDGDNLEEILQDTANQYINPMGSQWIKKMDISTTEVEPSNIRLCGVDNFTFISYGVDSSNNLTGAYTFDGGLTWREGSWYVPEIFTGTGVVYIECCRGANVGDFHVCIVGQYENSSCSPYLLEVSKSGYTALGTFGSFAQVDTEQILGIGRNRDSFVVYSSGNYIYTTPLILSGTTWTQYAVSLPANVKKMIYSKDFGKPIGMTVTGELAYPTWLKPDSTWITDTLESGTWGIVDISDAIGGIAMLIGTTTTSHVYYQSLQNRTHLTPPTLTDDYWQFISGSDTAIFLTSNKGVIGCYVKGQWDIVNSGEYSLLNTLNGNINNGNFILLQDKIIGAVSVTGSLSTSLLVAPLFSLK